MKNIFALLIITTLLSACSGTRNNTTTHISVSIEPIKYITEQITGKDFAINALVPSGASPETYEPTASQMQKTANALVYINIGLLDFEKNLSDGIKSNSPDVKILELSKGIDLIDEKDSHNNNEDDKNSESMTGNDAHGHAHAHGVDPHIWSSPKNIKQMARTIYEFIIDMYPDSTKYTSNYNHFISRLDSLDNSLANMFSGNSAKKVFIIYHPALSYLARDYGLEQICVEDEGKEPSASHIREIIENARKNGITKLFYQKQFSKNSVDAISEELGISAVEIDPLAGNVIDNTLYISDLIAH